MVPRCAPRSRSIFCASRCLWRMASASGVPPSRSSGDSCMCFTLMRYLSASRQLLDAARQGLTLVPFSAQLERFVWDRGCA